ncbi:MAG: tryptophan-rich sensory protein [Bacilli bacterium]|nr:tryptophan-rich sensory protein [Bacilli bacterium]
MKKNILEPIKYLLIPLVGGFIIGVISNTTSYNLIIPSIIFPIIWTILYTLMGISSYLVKRDGGNLKLYYLQLIINFLWPLIYFNLDAKFLALIIIIILIILVINMISYFKEYNKLAAKLQIPYLFWLTIALLLNIVTITN